MNQNNEPNVIPWVIIGMVFLLILVGGGMYGCPKYDVWQQGLKGQAELARAEQNRQIKVNEAMALKESATFRADAEIERARGVAGANKIIGQSLKGEEGEKYLRYLFVDMLRETGGDGRETIYLPTEAGLPILEANRLTKEIVINNEK